MKPLILITNDDGSRSPGLKAVTPLSVRMTAECLDSPGPDVLRFLT